MAELTVGVRELKSRLSEYLRRVTEGQTVVVTDHGRPVAYIVPCGQPLEARLEMMAQAGLLRWSGKKLQPQRPLAQTRGEGSVADLLMEE
jgi:prevent-host-death family protein